MKRGPASMKPAVWTSRGRWGPGGRVAVMLTCDAAIPAWSPGADPVKDWRGTARIKRGMSDPKRAGAVRHSAPPLSAGQLTARRAVRRRHRRRRRVAVLAALGGVLGGGVLVLR